PAPPDGAGRALAAGVTVRCAVRPEKLRLAPLESGPSSGPGFPVAVESRVYQGATTTWIVPDRPGPRFVVAEPSRSPAPGEAWRPGDDAFLAWDSRATVVLSDLS